VAYECPQFYVDHAVDAQKRGDWKGAAILWGVAARASVGMCRKERYWEAQRYCEEKFEEVNGGVPSK